MRELIVVLHPFLLIAVGVSILTIALLVLTSNSTPQNKYTFVYFTVGICGYLLTYGFMSLVKDDRTCLLLSHIGQIFINQISPAFYCFSVFFLDIRSQKKLALISPLGGFLIVWLLFSVHDHRIVHYWWGTFNVYRGTDAHIKLTLYFVWFFGYALVSFKNFYSAYQNERDPNRRLQIKYLLIALTIAYLASWDHLPILGIDVYPFGYIPVTLFSLIVFYTITKHQFLDVKIAVRRVSLLLLIYSFLLLISLPAAGPILKNLMARSGPDPTLIVLTIGAVIGLIFSSGPFIYAYFVRHSYWLRGTLATGLTHELKSPLGVLQGTMEVLNEQLASGTFDKVKTQGYLEMAQKNLDRLESTVKGLLNVAKIQEESVTIKKEETDLAKIVRFILDIQKPLADKKGISLSYNGPETLLAHADPEKMEQAVSNIIMNAVKFSEGGTIWIELATQDSKLHFSVKDQGAGLHQKDLTKIFDRFYQAQPNAKGSGIGLTIAKAWVEAHGGKIWAESVGEGKGTTITFTLPL